MLDDAPAKPLLSITRLAQALGVTRQTVHNWLTAGTCPVAPIVGTKPPKFLKSDVDALLKRGA